MKHTLCPAMNPCLPDWNFDCDVSLTSHKKPMGSDNELVELLWRNGHLVMHSQTHRRPSPGNNESRQVHQKHDHQILRGSGSYGYSSNIINDDETVSWIHYPVEDTFENDFCSNFFSELPNSDAMATDKPIRQFEDDKFTKLSASDTTHLTPSAQQSNTRQPFVPEVSGNPMPPPRIQVSDSGQQNQTPVGVGKVINFSQFAAPIRGGLGSNSSHFAGPASTNFTQGDIREGSVMTVGSSHCGSNQVVNDPDFSRASSIGGGTTGFSAGVLMEDIQRIVSPNEGRKTETLEPTITSSSGGSGSSFGGTTNKQLDTSSCKRKDRDDADELECQSGGAELDSASGKKPARSGSTRRTRAAEVHNLSERRRRDRINKKMRALQELIPHCNKTDKASMLDEAIDYLKSLQLQLQVMWMGSGMAPMMFPGVQHFMTPIGMGMGPSNLPAVQNSMHFPRVPMVDQSMPMTLSPSQTMIHNPVMNQVNFQNQIQNQMLSDQFARYMGMHPMQAASQPMNMFRFASPTVQAIHTSAPPAGSVGPFTGGTASNDISGGKMGQ